MKRGFGSLVITVMIWLGCHASIAAPVAEAAQPPTVSWIEKIIHSPAVLIKGRREEEDQWPKMVKMVKFYEGWFPNSYTCPAGVRTIGYGFTDPVLVRRGEIDEDTANKILDRKLLKLSAQVDDLVDVPLTSGQKCALVSFAYNFDIEVLKKVVEGPGRLNSGNYESIERILPSYRKGGGRVLPGLVKRRAAELKMWKM